MSEGQHNVNGYTKPVIVAIAAMGALGLVGLVLILSIEAHPEHGVVYAGLLTTLLATICGTLLTVVGLRKLGATTATVVYADEFANGCFIGSDREKSPTPPGRIAGANRRESGRVAQAGRRRKLEEG